MTAKSNKFEIEGRSYDGLIGSCTFPDGVGLCLMVKDCETGSGVVDICQVDATKRCFIEALGRQVPLAVLQRAMEIFEERVRVK